MQKLMMSLPWRAAAFTSASTTKAFSVPRLEARRLISGMRGPEKVLIMPPHARQLRGVRGRPQARGHREEPDPRLPRAPGVLRVGGAQGRRRGRARQLQEEFDLHPLAVEDARHGHQRPKLEEYGQSLFVVLNTIEVMGDELRAGELDIFVGRNYVLSVRRGTEHGFQDVRARCEREPELLRNGSGYVLYALMDAVVDRYFPVLDAVEPEH